MKLIRARFQNFRLLRDLTIDFSTDHDRRLTVIRAENKTGKTTILNALQWALYGDSALPGTRYNYRLHHWDVPNEQQVDVTVEVIFSAATTRFNRRSGHSVITEREYRIVRTVTETPLEDDRWERGISTATLYEYTDKGLEQIKDPDARIIEMLSPKLRDVFFTDSDRALSFIESDATRSVKRRRVEGAIRSLLGFDVIENSITHVGTTAKQVGAKALQSSASEDLEQVKNRIQEIDDEVEELNDKTADAEEQFNAFEQHLEDIRVKILEAASKGNRNDLVTEIKDTGNDLQRVYDDQVAARKAHSRLFRDLPLYRELLNPVLERSFAKLDELSDLGKIPKATIPVLEERLSGTTCICGESISGHDADGIRRRHNIQHLIDESREADDLSKSLTELLWGSMSLRSSHIGDEENWTNQYYGIHDRLDRLHGSQEDLEKRQKALETRLEQIPNVNIEDLKNTERFYQKQRDRFRDILVECEGTRNSRNREKPSLIQRRNRLIGEQVQDKLILAQQTVTQDIYDVLVKVYDRLTNEELSKVSDRMNDLFLRMVVADPTEGADIRRSEISKDFDIRVYSGTESRTVNPDLDLSGATSRALTMAFILALMSVSEVMAPSVIDTPLGMMSGLIRRSALQTAIDESSQIILFLTRSEIEGCEDILDAEAGKFVTLINAAHYPTMLVNDPGIVGSQAIRCDCDDLGACHFCKVKEERVLTV